MSDKKTILIAEDEYNNFLYLVELLEPYNFNILHAENGKKAFEIVNSNTPLDLILMDIKMPGMDGFYTTKLIKEIRPELPVVAQTAYALETEKTKYRGVFDDYITKPISENSFKEKLLKYINNDKTKSFMRRTGEQN